VAHVLTPRGQSGHDQARHAVGTAIAGDQVGGQVGGRPSFVEGARLGTQFVEQVAESESVSSGQGRSIHRLRG
jgi:hypothetical protein